LPTELVERFEVDVSGLEIGQSIQVKDLRVGPQFAIVTAGEVAIASVSAPRIEEEPAEGEEGEEPAEGEEPEVIGEEEKKAKETEGEDAGQDRDKGQGKE
jgi:large subunit ribosomal protein L25